MRSIGLTMLGVLACAGLVACGGDGDEAGGESQGPAHLAIYDWEGSLATPNPFPTESAASAKAQNGAVVVRDETDPDNPEFFVVAGEPALGTGDIVDPEAITDQAGQPAIVFDFTEEGKAKFQALTKAVVAGGGHFAIVVDGEVLSLPIIDASQYPNGLDGQNGAQISGGLTATEAEELADGLQQGIDLGVGPLP